MLSELVQLNVINVVRFHSPITVCIAVAEPENLSTVLYNTCLSGYVCWSVAVFRDQIRIVHYVSQKSTCTRITRMMMT